MGFRRFRAAFVIGSLWGIFWGTMTLLFFYAMLRNFSAFQQQKVHEALAVMGSVLLGAFALGAAMGFITGLLFSLLLAVLERKHEARPWNTMRFVLWGTLAALGIVGAVMLATGWPLPLLFVCVVGFCGAETALYTTYVARRAPKVLGATPREAIAPAPSANPGITRNS